MEDIIEMILLIIVMLLGFYIYCFPLYREMSKKDAPAVYDKIKVWIEQWKGITKG